MGELSFMRFKACLADLESGSVLCADTALPHT